GGHAAVRRSESIRNTPVISRRFAAPGTASRCPRPSSSGSGAPDRTESLSRDKLRRHVDTIACPPCGGWEPDFLTRKVFMKLMGLFALLLVFQMVVMEIVFRLLAAHRAALWSGLIALAAALPLAAWAALRVTGRLQQVVDFA